MFTLPMTNVVWYAT